MGMNAATQKKIIGITVLAAVIFIGGSYWTGQSTEQTFRDGIEEMAGYGVKVSLLDYQRSFFSATARTEWLTTLFDDEPVTLTFNHSIWHGPLLAFLSTASVRTELILPEELTGLLRKTFGSDPFKGKPPLTVTTAFGFAGGSSSRIVSPKFEATAKEGKVKQSWDGFDGKITTSSGYSKIKATITLDGLTVGSNEDLFRAGRTTFQSVMKRPDGYELLYVGTSSLTVDKLSFRGVEKDSGSIRAFTAENVYDESSTTINNGALGIEIRIGADTIVMDDQSDSPIKNPRLTFLCENLDARTFEAFSKAMRHQGGQQETLPVLQELLRYQPVFSVKNASANWPEGAMMGNARIAYVGDGNIAKFSLADLGVDLQLSLPVALINRLLAEQTARGLAEKSKQQIAMFNTMIKNGVLVEEDDVLTVDASLKDGVLVLNGTPKPLGVLEGVLDF